MNEQQKRQWAEVIIRESIESIEFSAVYEHEALEGQSDSVFEDIMELVKTANVHVAWPSTNPHLERK